MQVYLIDSGSCSSNLHSGSSSIDDSTVASTLHSVCSCTVAADIVAALGLGSGATRSGISITYDLVFPFASAPIWEPGKGPGPSRTREGKPTRTRRVGVHDTQRLGWV